MLRVLLEFAVWVLVVVALAVTCVSLLPPGRR
ncbi:uncharacterized protein YhdP [Phytomonospora endophytica]|uniref:Uncharacterized protein YhdP n=1 Tax=Phytomonospora endophytica TaxID=714109 RepID=A0A841FRR9_9ACTN|nr:uncharacterized protein YhdP [Phytomonospora endophytica]